VDSTRPATERLLQAPRQTSTTSPVSHPLGLLWHHTGGRHHTFFSFLQKQKIAILFFFHDFLLFVKKRNRHGFVTHFTGLIHKWLGDKVKVQALE
jgi:hypothetical protein